VAVDSSPTCKPSAPSANLSEFYKKRLGKYRIIYTYDDNADELIVRLVDTRDDIYKKARK